METENSKEAKTRMVHVRLSEAIHRKVRIHAAEADQTIQDWVLQAIQDKLESKDSMMGTDQTEKSHSST